MIANCRPLSAGNPLNHKRGIQGKGTPKTEDNKLQKGKEDFLEAQKSQEGIGRPGRAGKGRVAIEVGQ